MQARKMNKMINYLNQFFVSSICFCKSRGGSTAIEYALIASLIALVIIGAVTMLGGNLSNSYDDTANAIKSS